MGVSTSEVGYTPAMPRREDHEVHKDMWWHWAKKNTLTFKYGCQLSLARDYNPNLSSEVLMLVLCTCH